MAQEFERAKKNGLPSPFLIIYFTGDYNKILRRLEEAIRLGPRPA
jgi:hypothetical protein